jgi:hypothetical protein
MLGITVERTDAGWIASVDSPRQGITWKTERPMRQRELIDELLALGQHRQDIGDAFREADPDWLKHD